MPLEVSIYALFMLLHGETRGNGGEDAGGRELR